METRLQIPTKPTFEPTRSYGRTAPGILSRKNAGGGEVQPQAALAPPIVHDVLRSPGQPLDAKARQFMEPRFGQNFGGVRVHTDEKAAESARAVNAQAYTVGRDIVFANPPSSAETGAGSHILAHELAHVLQQSGTRASSAPLAIGRADSLLESDAERTAGAALSSEPGTQSPQARAPSLQRLPAGAAPDPSPAPGPRGAQKWPVDDRNDYYVFFQLALQGVSGKADLKTAKQKAEMADMIADACMNRFTKHGPQIKCATDATDDPAAKQSLRQVLALSSQWGESLKGALQSTTGGDYKTPDQPVKQAFDIADQAVLASGQLEQPLWTLYVNCAKKDAKPAAKAGSAPAAKSAGAGH